MFLLLGYKTYGLAAISIAAQIFGYMRPEYAATASMVSGIALSGTPATLRSAISKLPIATVAASLKRK